MSLTQVSSGGIKDATVSAADIAADAVTTAKIANDNVVAGKLATDSVTTLKILDGNVTTPKIADNAITTDKIANDNVVAGKLGTNSVTTLKIADDAVTAAKIADDAVGAEHIEQLDADLSFADNAKAKFGAGNDLQIDHSGTNSQIYHDGTGHLYIATQGSGEDLVFQAKNEFKVSTADSERMRIDSSGNIGLGTSTPTSPDGSNADNSLNGPTLTVYGDSPAINLTSSTTEASDYSLINFGRTGSSSNPYRAVIGYKQSDDILRINAQNHIAFDAGGGINSNERMRIDGSGKIGIGLTNPVNNLDVSGSISATGNMLNTAYADGVYIGTNGGLPAITAGKASNSAYAPLVFRQDHQAAGAERMRIDASGRVHIGNSGLSATSNSDDLTVGNLSGDHGITIHSATDGAGFICFGDTDTTGVGSRDGVIRYQQSDNSMRFATNGNNERMRILAGGGITFNGDTAAANALDDYEEGTFSPTVASGGTASSYTHQYGYYIKIGRVVHWQIYMAINGSGSSGGFTLGSFPFTSGAYNSTAYGVATVGYANNTFQTDDLYMYFEQNSTTLIFRNKQGQAIAGNSGAIFANADFIISGQYITA